MSGGKFDYKEYWIQEIAREVEETLDIHERKPKGVYDGLDGVSDETLKMIEDGAVQLRKAYAFAYNVDRLLEGDTCEESFIRDMEEDLQRIENNDYEKGRYYTDDEE